MSKEYGSDMGPLPSNIAGHIALHESRLVHDQEDPWKTTRRFCGRFECVLGYLVNVHEHHSSSSSSSGRKYAKNHIWDSLEQLFEEIM